MKFLKEVALTWQFFAYIVLVIVLLFLLFGKLNITSLRAGSFEMVLEKNAEKFGVAQTPEFQNLKQLNEEDLKLFLIMGGEDASWYRFTNTKLDGAAAVAQYEKLQSASLMSIERKSKDTTIIHPTEIGKKVHKALIQSLYTQLEK